MDTQKLIDAARLIQEAMASLDTTASTCACCGVTKYDHFREFQAHRELEAVVHKLKRMAANPQLQKERSSRAP